MHCAWRSASALELVVSESQTLTLPDGLQLAACAWGNPQHPPIIAMHGWLDNAASFSTLAPYLAAEYHVIALDLPGHGHSQARPPGLPYHHLDWVSDIIDVLDVLDLPAPITLMGHSMGASIAALSASVLGDRVKHLILIEGLGPLVTPAEDSPERLRNALDARRRSRAVTPRVYKNHDEIVARLCTLHPLMHEESARRLVMRGSRTTPEGVLMRYDHRLRNPSHWRLTEEHVLAFFRAIACPVFAIRARQGFSMPNPALEARLACFQHGLDILEVEGGHHVHLDAPERLAPALGAWLRRGLLGSRCP